MFDHRASGKGKARELLLWSPLGCVALQHTFREAVLGHRNRVTQELNRTVRVLTGTTLLVLVMSAGAKAQTGGTETESPGAQTEALEEVIVTGTRRAARTATNVASAVDVIGSTEMEARPDSNMINLLRTSVPSFNTVSDEHSGTPSSMRPVSLRGLSPDHTLVLIDGKRRHRGANIQSFAGAASDGAQGPDLMSIPTIALKQIQVLRDGAAAQYGSDAIAGVINFILNDDPHGYRMEARYGSTYEGDGERYAIAGTAGFPLADTGFVRFSGEYAGQNKSFRNQRDANDRAFLAGENSLIDPSDVRPLDKKSSHGIPDIDDDLKLMVNMAAPINDQADFYAFGNYSQRTVEGLMGDRNPANRPGLFTDNNSNWLVGDLTPDDGINCEGGVDFGGTNIVNDPIAVGAPDQVTRMNEVFTDPNCFSWLEKFPGGVATPFGSDIFDIAGVLGVRSELDNGFTYDISAGAGRNAMKFFQRDLPNPSLGPQSPAELRIGDRVQFERFFNIDASYAFENDLFASPFFIAAGFEWRDEEYQIKAGQEEAWQAGILAPQGFVIGAEFIGGFSPRIAGTHDQEKRGVYVDLEVDPVEKLTLGVAARYEEFSRLADSETTFKMSGMYHITDIVAVRSTISTGYHAPSVGQTEFFTTTNESILRDDGTIENRESGQLPPTNPVAQALGAEPLRPETAENYTLGLVFTTDWATLTLDAYRIDMDDRITVSASRTLTEEQKQALVDAGFQSAANLTFARFFTNDFASETKGLDLVLSVPYDIGGGQGEVNMAANYNTTDVTSFDPDDPDEVLDENRVYQLEETYPKLQGNVTSTYAKGKWQGLARVHFVDEHGTLQSRVPFQSDARVLVDLEVGYDITDRLQVFVGAENVFGTEPTRIPPEFGSGNRYALGSPRGVDNGLWYLRLNYRQ